MTAPTLPDVWLAIIGFLLLYYAVTDGFDLGVGVLSLAVRDPGEQRVMMQSLAGVWHGNQTWLLLLGGMLFGAFPHFYGVVLSSLYVPLFVMLFGLMFRAVAFEFHAESGRALLWRRVFGLGSLVAAVGQGLALGGLLGGAVGQGTWAWLSPFSGAAAVGLLLGYAMLGANYLVWKADGRLQRRARGWARGFSWATFAISAAVHAWLALLYPHAAAKWRDPGDAAVLGGLLCAALAAFGMLLRAQAKGRELAPLLWNAALVLFSFSAVSVALYPQMVPHFATPVTVAAAAASDGTLLFMLVVTALVLPLNLGYTLYTYRAMRGKVRVRGH